MADQLLSTLAIIGSGTVAGVLFAVALSTLPALMAMPPGNYVYAHKLLGRNWDPAMPVIVLTSTALTLVLTLRAANPQARYLFLTATVLLLLVSVVSHLCNVPINKRVRHLEPDAIPADWQDPRPLWRRWHLLRTALAMLALAVNAWAAVATL